MRRILHLYLRSSLHVSLSVTAFTLLSFLQFDLPVDIFLLGYTFFASVVAYNFIKYAAVWKKGNIYKPTSIKVITALCFIGLLINMFFVPFKVIQLSTSLAFLIYAYTFPVSKHIKKLRQIPLLKLVIIAFVWSIVSLLFPVFSTDKNISLDILFFKVAERMVWIFALMIPFEIRDLADDEKNGSSLVSIIGVTSAKYLSIGLLILLFGLHWFFISPIAISDLLIYISLLLAILFARRKQPTYYSSLLVESLPIFWVLFWVLIGD